MRRIRLIAGIITLTLAVVCLLLPWLIMIRMPGKSFRGPLPALTSEEASLVREVEAHVRMLAGEIGQRNVEHPDQLARAAAYIENELRSYGYAPQRQSFMTRGVRCDNIEVGLRGTSAAEEIVVVGAHYDSVFGSPGANDNGSGTAALLALARRFSGKPQPRTIRFVAFVNEEPPNFLEETMGSLVYARRSKARGEKIVAMLSLETIGYYSDEKNSQKYPFPLNLAYPSTADFLGFVGNVDSRALVRKSIEAFRQHVNFPSEGAAVPGAIPGVGWSDHWSFWQMGYPAVMVTDTALFRYPHYHLRTDTPEQVNHEKLARVITGLRGVVEDLGR